MSYFFGCNKTPEQCRTHHQKVLLKYKSIENILENFLKDLREKNKQKTGEVPKIVEITKDYEVQQNTNGGIKIQLKNFNFQEW